eukprot:gene17452-19197_t
MASNNDILEIKARYGRHIRRVEIKRSLRFNELKAVLSGLFNRAFDVIKYTDDEGDLVTLSSQEEFNESIRKVVPKTGGLLKLVLLSNDNDQTKDSECIGNTRKRSADNMQRNFPNKKNNSDNKVEYYASLSAALKDLDNEKTAEEMQAEVQPAQTETSSQHQSNYEELRHLCKQNTDVGNDEVKASEKAVKAKLVKKKIKRRRRYSSSSSSSGSSSDLEEAEMMNDASRKEYRARMNKRRKRQRRRHEIKMIARHLAHYVVPDVCDEVAHCMHHYKKELKHSMAKKLVNTIESSVSHAVKKCVDSQSLERMSSAEQHQEVEEMQPAPPSMPRPTRERYHHDDITCDGCECEIDGPRYKCGNCSDYDLCEDCEAIEGIHDQTHVFLKMHYPAVDAGRKTGGFMKPLLKKIIYNFNEDRGETDFNLAMQSQQALDLKVLERPVVEENKVENPSEELEKMVPVRTVSTESTSVRDEEIAVALEGLKIAQSVETISTAEAPNTEEKVEESMAEKQEEKIDADPHDVEDGDGGNESEDDDDDVVVVVKQDAPTDSMPQIKNLDLIDIDAASVSSNGSEDFVVVPIPKYFDINSPLDAEMIMEHRRHCTNHEHGANCCPAALKIKKQSKSAPTIPVDLVASSLPKSRQEPDIAAIPNLMDADIPNSSSSSSSSSECEVIAQQPGNGNEDVHPVMPIVIQPDTKPIKPEDPKLKQPELPLIYGRGAVPLMPQTKEPDAPKMRDARPKLYPDVTETMNRNDVAADNVVKDGGKSRNTIEDITSEQAVKAIASEPAQQQSTDATATGKTPIDFNHPAEKFTKQHRDYRERMKKESDGNKPSTWAPESPEVGESALQALKDIGSAFVSAANSVIGGGNELPNVKYEEEQVKILRNADTPSQVESITNRSPAMSAQDMLKDMGFYDENKNRRLLARYKGNVNDCVNELLGDNDWHNNRH